MDSRLTKEQRAHDLAIAYELCCAIQEKDSKPVTFDGFAQNYNRTYEEFMNYLKD